MRRGQITVFIILGLVIFITFLLVSILTAKVSKTKLEQGSEKAMLDAIKNTNTDTYVELCLKQITGKGLLLLGAQGGYLWALPNGLQNGSIDPSSVKTLQTGDTYIAYGMLFPPAQVDYPDAPTYPFENRDLFKDTSGNPTTPPWIGMSWGYFGEKKLVPLCDPDGGNNISEEVRLSYGMIAPCNKGFYGKDSVQWQLERFVEKELRGCISLDALARNLGVSLGEPQVSLTLGESNIYLNATYPINISTDAGIVNRRIDFQTFLPVRLRKMYAYVDSLLLNDAFYANYSLLEHYQENRWWDNKVEVQRQAIDETTDMLIVTDQASLINSRPFSLTVALQNRRPALDYIHDSAIGTYPEVDGQQVDVVVPVGGQVMLSPVGVDPDEDIVTYTYGKWREEYGETFDWQCCLNDAESYQRCTDTLFRSCISRTSTPPHEWSSSPIFPIGALATQSQDIGLHTVRITVCDGEQLEDYQDIGVFVNPLRNEVGSFTCGQDPGNPANDPLLNCECGPGTGACVGQKFTDIIRADTCTNGAYCDPSCVAHYPNDNADACRICNGGNFFSGSPSICCGPNQCGRLSGGRAECLDQGIPSGEPYRFCYQGNIHECNLGNNNCIVDGKYCSAPGAPQQSQWLPGTPPSGGRSC